MNRVEIFVFAQQVIGHVEVFNVKILHHGLHELGAFSVVNISLAQAATEAATAAATAAGGEGITAKQHHMPHTVHVIHQMNAASQEQCHYLISIED